MVGKNYSHFGRAVTPPRMLCSKCGRNIHYRCSFLPPYQIQYFVANRRRNMKSFCCINCVDVPNDIMDLCKENKIQFLINLIHTLDRDVAACKNIIKVHQEKERDTLSAIKSYKSKITNLNEKTINSHTAEYLGEKMLEIGLMIKESICEEIQSSNAEMKSKITDTTKSYANVAKNGVVQSNSDLKTIIHEARHAEMTEQRDRNSRTCNIIIHRVAEDQADDREAEKKYVATLFENIKVPVNIKRIARIGIRADVKKRPIKVNEKEKKPCLEKSCSLKK